MNNKFEKKLIISIIISIIIIIIVSTIMLTKLKNSTSSNEDVEIENINTANLDSSGDNVEGSYVNITNGIIDREAFENVNSCMATYLTNLNIEKSSFYRTDSNGKKIQIIEDKDIKQLIYDVLSENYKSKNGITVDNLYEKTRTLKEQVIYVPLELSVLQDKEIKSFLAHGLVENLEYKAIGEIYAIVNINFERKLFSIQPLSGKFSSIKDVKIDQFDNKIVETENNTFSTSSTLKYDDVGNEYLTLYKRLAIGAPSKMYNLLDKNYREKKFGNEENFKNYIEKNKDKIYGLRLEKYDASEKDNYTQYVCVDQYGNTYVFKENAVLDYTVLLDTHTIDITEFTEKYDKAKDNQKVVLNVQKIIEAINDSDYSYIYSKLDNTYKSNNFKQQADLEKYISKNYFIGNTAEYTSCKQEGSIYICTFSITDSTGKNTKKQERKIAMQLLDNRNFVMSFILE